MAMPYQYARDDAARRIKITLTDPLTVVERIAAVEQQVADDAWRYGTLIDARHLAVYAPKPKEMQAVVARVAEFVAEYGPRGPVAVVSNRAAVISAGQMYNHFGGKRNAVEVFWDLDEARKFLDQQDANNP
jgi:hypothetical protein